MRIQTILTLTFAASSAMAQSWVPTHTRQDGTVVQGHMRSAPDANRYNNYGSQSNGGHQRDEFSSNGGATNRTNPTYGWRDNDRDGTLNSMDRQPNTRRGW